jgi:sugar phosphate isomerase/epimerase
MDRRSFVHSLATSVAGASLGSRLSVGAATRIGDGLNSRTGSRFATARLDRIGLELYSVRDAMRRDPETTLAAVRAAGYTDVELLWSFKNFDRTPAQVRATLQHEGLRAPSAHIAPEAILDEWPRSLADAKLLGHEYLIVPSLTPDAQTSLDVWRKWADRFNTAGATARDAGIWLAFHNEPDHLKPIDGVVPYDLFAERTDPSVVRLQLDVGNLAMGGGDPLRYLRKYNNRYFSFHIKDVVADHTRDTELGEGVVDLRAILAAIPDIAHKPVYVEQEGATDSLASARRNCRYLATLDF